MSGPKPRKQPTQPRAVQTVACMAQAAAAQIVEAVSANRHMPALDNAARL